MSNRFGRDTSRNSLFSTYDRSTSPSKNKPSRSPGRPTSGYGYGYTPPSSADHLAASNGPAFSAYPSASANGTIGAQAAFRPATPNSRGQYSDAVLSELESQNDDQVGILTGKVRMLKDLTSAIGDEIRDSTTLAEKMNDSFDNTRLKLRGTMNRMLRMAEKTGVGWRVWLGFFAAVIFLFWYVWLF
ncbi:uncharacterized protein BDR25DRAFT_307674 [Lindgomyces ingoldianus]|uniref:Uncharacterized protein n=1 Tax=Lindgomyces ingoldianus TaxID=673940 RepID=A0ACB6Q9R8_9PLEO|nr:uncharacterized protein BDR25DRAFT_307674 [Lindgomyces ingoldianus]KAF2463646.1 hypothetical protein BDR25DRAFT_307674 [Lindgomyces ingoldianus]